MRLLHLVVAALSDSAMDALDRLDLRAARAGDEVSKDGEMNDMELDALVAEKVFGLPVLSPELPNP